MRASILEAAELLTESISYNYKVPEDREERIFDFYLWTMYYQSIDRLGADPKVRIGDNDLEDMQAIIKEAVKQIVPTMKEELLEIGMMAVASELTHVKAMATEVDIMSVANQHGEGKRFMTWLNGFLDSKLQPGKNIVGHKARYDAAYAAALNTWGEQNYIQFMELAQDMFSNIEWEEGYGGEYWADICEALIDLKKSSTLKQDILKIDHLIDLEHNTGVLLDKAHKYRLYGGGEWIKVALDAKAKLDPKELAALSSIPARIAGRFNRAMGLDKAFDQPPTPYEGEDEDEKKNIDDLRRRYSRINTKYKNLISKENKTNQNPPLPPGMLGMEAAHQAYMNGMTRWKNAEPVILKDPRAIYVYARLVLNDTWEEGEQAISVDPQYAYMYAREFRKPWSRDSLAYETIYKSNLWRQHYEEQVLLGKKMEPPK